MTYSYSSKIQKLVDEHGSLPPPWAAYPRVHPMDICWRMGGGEGYKFMFDEWDAPSAWSVAQRVAYIRQWDPPFSWLEWVAFFVWREEYDGGEYAVHEEHFARLADLGFGSLADWRRSFEVDPEAYPVEGDVSRAWPAKT
jgi:hypothetical protein